MTRGRKPRGSQHVTVTNVTQQRQRQSVTQKGKGTGTRTTKKNLIQRVHDIPQNVLKLCLGGLLILGATAAVIECVESKYANKGMNKGDTYIETNNYCKDAHDSRYHSRATCSKEPEYQKPCQKQGPRLDSTVTRSKTTYFYGPDTNKLDAPY